MDSIASSALAVGGDAWGNLMSLSADILVIIALFGAIFFFATFRGNDQLIGLLIASYMGLSIENAFPLGSNPPRFLSLLLFVGATTGAYIVVVRLLSLYGTEGGIRTLVWRLIISGVATIFFLSIAIHEIPIGYTFDIITIDFLTEPYAHFAAIVLPLIIFFFL